MNKSNVENKDQYLTTAVSLRGYGFNYLDSEWKLDRNHIVPVQFLDKLDVHIGGDIRKVLVYYAENYSAGYTSVHAQTLYAYFTYFGCDTFSEKDLITYKSTMGFKKRYKIRLLKIFISQMIVLKLDGNLSKNIPELVNKWRISAGAKYKYILNLDPKMGPFSDIEFEAIGHVAANKFANNLLSLEEYALLLTMKSTGRRPEQIATLKIKDFVISNKYTQQPIFCLNIPRIKIRNAPFRTQLAAFGLVNSTGQILTEYIKWYIQETETLLSTTLTPEQKNEMPLFANKSCIRFLMTHPQEEWTEGLRSERVHMKSVYFSNWIRKIVESLDVISERTGKPVHVTGYRFRYTLGTRAAREGSGKLTIAKLLDHTTLSSVEHYVKNIPEFALEISRVMNDSLINYASAFAGHLTKNEEAANLIHPGCARIPFQEKNCDVGSCGAEAYCTDYAPIACYTCPKFKPWSDAPHHFVLEWLLEERRRISELTGDITISAINDRSIIAVMQVMNACAEYKKNA